jgi:hypothetical protein
LSSHQNLDRHNNTEISQENVALFRRIIYLETAREPAALTGERSVQMDDHVFEIVIDFHVERADRAAAVSDEASAALFGFIDFLAHAVLNRKLVFGLKSSHCCKQKILISLSVIYFFATNLRATLLFGAPAAGRPW